MSWIIDALRPFARWTQAKVALSQRQTVEWDPTVFLLTDDPPNARVFVTLAAAAAPVVATIHVTGDATIDGSIVQGPSIEKSGRAATAGPATAVLFTTPLALNSLAGIDFRVAATDGAKEYLTGDNGILGFATYGSPGYVGGSPSISNSFPISPSISSAWALGVSPAGTLTTTVRGPGLVVTGAADNGGGFVRLMLGYPAGFSGAGVTAAINSVPITTAGIAGTVEANGAAQTVTFVDAGHVDLLAVPFVHAFSASAGTFVETTPRNLLWSGRIVLCVAP